MPSYKPAIVSTSTGVCQTRLNVPFVDSAVGEYLAQSDAFRTKSTQESADSALDNYFRIIKSIVSVYNGQKTAISNIYRGLFRFLGIATSAVINESLPTVLAWVQSAVCWVRARGDSGLNDILE